MIAIIDYGVGNLYSLSSSLKYLGIENAVTADKNKIEDASGVILPGVGAFADAMAKLQNTGLAPVLENQAKSGKPLLGICLGMQMLFSKSFEYGEHKGLGFIPGIVAPLSADLKRGAKVPHIGWNSLEFYKPSAIYKYINGGEYVYFVHSYYAKGCESDVTAAAMYEGVKITASVGKDNVFGVQYHPEKSGAAGLKILKAFCEIK
ncbi:MAG: imidazole glycerol phosphate synthase subunit HisH [Clostridia bacterium]|nr:imidazole glycerol phosphate synthase subunit HisH [Clostridia bacterium]